MNIKAIVKLLTAILILADIPGCKSIKERYPQDFGFKVENMVETISSYDSTYRRNYFRGDSIVKIQFSDSELKDIYNSIIKNGLDRYPYNYSPTCKIHMMPNLETKIQFRINGEYKTLESLYDCRTGPFKNRKNEKIRNTITMIEKIATSKSEVKRLSKTNITFL